MCRVSTKGRQELSLDPPDLRAVCSVRKSKLRKELFPLKFTAVRAKLSRNDSSAAPSRAWGGIPQSWEIKEQLLQLHTSCEAMPLLSPFSTSQTFGMTERGWRMGGKRGCWRRKSIGDGTISCPWCQRVHRDQLDAHPAALWVQSCSGKQKLWLPRAEQALHSSLSINQFVSFHVGSRSYSALWLQRKQAN